MSRAGRRSGSQCWLQHCVPASATALKTNGRLAAGPGAVENSSAIAEGGAKGASWSREVCSCRSPGAAALQLPGGCTEHQLSLLIWVGVVPNGPFLGTSRLKVAPYCKRNKVDSPRVYISNVNNSLGRGGARAARATPAATCTALTASRAGLPTSSVPPPAPCAQRVSIPRPASAAPSRASPAWLANTPHCR